MITCGGMGSGKPKYNRRWTWQEYKERFPQDVRQKTKVRESTFSDEHHHQPGNNRGGEGFKYSIDFASVFTGNPFHNLCLDGPQSREWKSNYSSTAGDDQVHDHLRKIWTYVSNVKGSMSRWRSVSNGVPQDSLWRPVHFNFFIKNIEGLSAHSGASLQMTASSVQLTHLRNEIPSRWTWTNLRSRSMWISGGTTRPSKRSCILVGVILGINTV